MKTLERGSPDSMEGLEASIFSARCTLPRAAGFCWYWDLVLNVRCIFGDIVAGRCRIELKEHDGARMHLLQALFHPLCEEQEGRRHELMLLLAKQNIILNNEQEAESILRDLLSEVTGCSFDELWVASDQRFA